MKMNNLFILYCFILLQLTSSSYCWSAGFTNPRAINQVSASAARNSWWDSIFGKNATSTSNDLDDLNKLLQLFEDKWSYGLPDDDNGQDSDEHFKPGVYESLMKKTQSLWNNAVEYIVESQRERIQTKFSENVNQTIQKMAENIPDSIEGALFSLLNPNGDPGNPPKDKRYLELWKFFFSQGNLFVDNFEQSIRDSSRTIFESANSRISEAILRGIKKNIQWESSDQNLDKLRCKGNLCDGNALANAPFSSPEHLLQELKAYSRTNKGSKLSKRSYATATSALKILLVAVIFQLPSFKIWVADKIDNAVYVICEEIEPEIHLTTLEIIDKIRSSLSDQYRNVFNWFFPLGIKQVDLPTAGIKQWFLKKLSIVLNKVVGILHVEIQGTIANYIFAGEFQILEYIRNSMRQEIAKTIPFKIYTADGSY